MSGQSRLDGLPDAPPDACVPIPPRFWWLKRIALAAAVLLAGLIGLRVWWGRVADQRLQAAIDRYRAAGQPVYPEDFDTPHVPDEQNAVKALRDAEAAIALTAEQRSLLDARISDPAAWRERAEEVRALLDANTNALDLLDRARTSPGVDWDIQVRSPMIGFMPPNLSGQRLVARVSCVAVIYRHYSGDDAGAVALARSALSQAKRIGQLPGSIITQLVAMAVSELAISGIEQITPTLQVSGSPEPEGRSAGSANRSQVRALIAELLAETPFRDGWCRAIYGERAFQLDVAQGLAGGRMGPWAIGATGAGTSSLCSRVSGLILGPMFVLDAVRAARHCTDVAEVGRDAAYPATLRREQETSLVSGPSGISGFTRLLSRTMMPPYSRFAQLHFRGIVRRRRAAAALAIRLFELDHGTRPERLDELVPGYLPAVPLDPFAEDGRSIAYLPHEEHPILYSVGPNGLDEGGAFETRGDGWVNPDAKDDPLFLDGARPGPKVEALASAPTSTQAGTDEQNVENNEGKSDQEQHPQ